MSLVPTRLCGQWPVEGDILLSLWRKITSVAEGLETALEKVSGLHLVHWLRTTLRQVFLLPQSLNLLCEEQRVWPAASYTWKHPVFCPESSAPGWYWVKFINVGQLLSGLWKMTYSFRVWVLIFYVSLATTMEIVGLSDEVEGPSERKGPFELPWSSVTRNLQACAGRGQLSTFWRCSE